MPKWIKIKKKSWKRVQCVFLRICYRKSFKVQFYVYLILKIQALYYNNVVFLIYLTKEIFHMIQLYLYLLDNLLYILIHLNIYYLNNLVFARLPVQHPVIEPVPGLGDCGEVDCTSRGMKMRSMGV